MTTKKSSSPYESLEKPQYLSKDEEDELENILERLTKVHGIIEAFFKRRGQAINLLMGKLSEVTHAGGLDLYYSITDGKSNSWNQTLDLNLSPLHITVQSKTSLQLFHERVRNSIVKKNSLASIVVKNSSTTTHGVTRNSLTYALLVTKYAELLTAIQPELCNAILTVSSPTKDIEKMDNLIATIFGAVTTVISYAGGFAVATIPTALRFALGVSIIASKALLGASADRVAERYRMDVICDINQTLEELTKILAPNDARNIISILKDPRYESALKIKQCQGEVQRAIDAHYDKAERIINNAKIKHLENKDRMTDNEIFRLKEENRKMKEDYKEILEILKKQSDLTQKKRQDSMRAVNSWVRNHV